MFMRLILAPVMALSLFIVPAHALFPVAPSELMLSWRSNALSPAGYVGRVPPSVGSTVLITGEALVNGIPSSLKGYEVRWYVDGEFYQSGFGLHTITIRIPGVHGSNFDVRMEIVDAPFAATNATLTIPIGGPSVVITGPRDLTLREGILLFRAVPYGFNVARPNDLVFTWTVNGVAPDATENPEELSLNLKGTPTEPVVIEVTVRNTVREGEAASSRIILESAS